MSRKAQALLLKSIVPMGYALLLYICIYLIPDSVNILAAYIPAFTPYTTSVVLFGCFIALPIAIALFLAYRIFDDFGRDLTFSMKNAARLSTISKLAFCDCMLLIAGYLLAAPAIRLHSLTVLLIILGCFMCFAASAVCLVLSRLIAQATLIKEENEFTI